ncbi:hypothetical protein CONPUDRAFT_150532 [Coniophora puteana RWD-64-598 SS2]|uniref:Uncharacterized protein n=1 Tax=Coniophora puteana (strain RWD-64-598) TaxID=741705 RepID=A0A5M3N4B7_CONPW|nr:uncharacterized protein CONPUDRAFT_150532 [Coniophora puteana RWD-64-598 SS2]EIW85751.1 hypothetical protein CONPUDRAFT_150532 [Coniophora puteana RWD-64-598 SS2]
MTNPNAPTRPVTLASGQMGTVIPPMYTGSDPEAMAAKFGDLQISSASSLSNLSESFETPDVDMTTLTEPDLGIAAVAASTSHDNTRCAAAPHSANSEETPLKKDAPASSLPDKGNKRGKYDSDSDSSGEELRKKRHNRTAKQRSHWASYDEKSYSLSEIEEGEFEFTDSDGNEFEPYLINNKQRRAWEKRLAERKRTSWDDVVAKRARIPKKGCCAQHPA